MDREELSRCSSQELGDAIGQLHGAYAALHKSLLEVICTYDEKEARREDGAISMVAWLAYYLGLSFSPASEWVRVARALRALPFLRAAYASGRLTWENLRALSRVATPDTEQELVERAAGMTASQAEALVRSLRPVTTSEAEALVRSLRPVTISEAEEAISKRSLRFSWIEEQRTLRLSGRLPDSDGAVAAKALEHLAEKARADPSSGLYDRFESRCAGALVSPASTYLGEEGDADRATVVVHVDADLLRGGEGSAEIESGPTISAETARRLACDSYKEVVADGPDGQPLGIGLRRRDRGCRFPGCARARWVHAHMKDWADGGATDRDNQRCQ